MITQGSAHVSKAGTPHRNDAGYFEAGQLYASSPTNAIHKVTLEYFDVFPLCVLPYIGLSNIRCKARHHSMSSLLAIPGLRANSMFY